MNKRKKSNDTLDDHIRLFLTARGVSKSEQDIMCREIAHYLLMQTGTFCVSGPNANVMFIDFPENGDDRPFEASIETKGGTLVLRRKED